MDGFDLEPGGINCDAVLADVYLYLDHEGDPQLRDRIQRHLDSCSPCLKHVGLEQDVRALISRCCGGDRAPASLHERVRLRITEVSVERRAE